MTDAVLILDCGATSVRAVAVDASGVTLAKASRPNETIPGGENPDWHVWPLDIIMDKLGACSRAVLAELGQTVRIKGLAVTTFGVDGALVDAQTKLVYPVISWKCPRTQDLMDSTDALFGGTAALQEQGGVGRFSFNTIYKLAWLKQNRPDALAAAKSWLFMPSLIVASLGAEHYTDRTMAGTSGLTKPDTGTFNPLILEKLGLESSLFPPLKDAGEAVGKLDAPGAARLGLEPGIPIFAAGHDTQCALIGSGAGQNQAVLSTGTWEILMARTPKVDLAAISAQAASTCELDAVSGLMNPGLQWLASGVLEWVKNTFYPDQTGYEKLLADAASVEPGSGGIRFSPGFYLSGSAHKGSISGLSHLSGRDAIYRASLEGLAMLLKTQLKALETMCGFCNQELIMVGGGTKNRVWNQIKADVLGLPIRVVNEAETTVLGAACCVLKGLGLAPTLEAARARFKIETDIYQPGPQAAAYAALAASNTRN